MSEAASPPTEGPSVAVPVYADLWDLELGAALTLLRLAGGAGAAHTVARSRTSVVGAGGLVTTPQLIFAALPEPAAVFIPGGPGAQKAARDPLLREFLRAQAARGIPLGASGSGVLALGEAGLLKDRVVAVTAELADTAWGFAAGEVRAGGWAQDGPIVTARGGLGALDVTLALAALVWGEAAAQDAAGRVGHPWTPVGQPA